MGAARLEDLDDVLVDLIAQPLDWFFAEHYRHRQFCALVSDLAAAPAFDGERLTRIVDFLRHDLLLHFIDEEEDLFPLLRRRALPEDDIEAALGRLSAEHRADVAQAEIVRGALEICLAERRPPSSDPALRKDLRDFAAHELRHLALENAVVLPIARLRLTERDLAGLSRRLAARRGLVLQAQGA
ncbi:MAG: hemerythrin domain-containing protein [Pseudomonadota bacterium]